MQEQKQLKCYHHAHLCEDIKEGLEVDVDQWKIIKEEKALYSKSFLSCVAVFAILKELGQDNRVALYLYHKRADHAVPEGGHQQPDINYDDYHLPKNFMREMCRKEVETIYVFSKTGDISSQHYANVPKLIDFFREVIFETEFKSLPEVKIHRIEVPQYGMASFDPGTKTISLGHKYGSQASSDRTEIFIEFSQILQELTRWGSTQILEIGFGGEDDEAQLSPFFNAILTEDLKRETLIRKVAQNILDHQAEDGGDPFNLKVYKALARVQYCDVIITTNDEKTIRVYPPLKTSTKTEPLILEKRDNQYKLLTSLPISTNVRNIQAESAAKDMSLFQFKERLNSKRGVTVTASGQGIFRPVEEEKGTLIEKKETQSTNKSCCSCIIL